DAVFTHVRKEVHGLHRRVREERTLILPGDLRSSRRERRLHITILAFHFGLVAVEKFFEQFIMIGSTLDRMFWLILDAQGFTCLHNLPRRFADNRDVILE